MMKQLRSLIGVALLLTAVSAFAVLVCFDLVSKHRLLPQAVCDKVCRPSRMEQAGSLFEICKRGSRNRICLHPLSVSRISVYPLGWGILRNL